MNIYELSFLVCWTVSPPFDDRSYVKTCEWRRDGALFAAESLCDAAGREGLGRVRGSDTMIVNSTLPTQTEHRCSPRAVRDK